MPPSLMNPPTQLTHSTQGASSYSIENFLQKKYCSFPKATSCRLQQDTICTRTQTIMLQQQCSTATVAEAEDYASAVNLTSKSQFTLQARSHRGILIHPRSSTWVITSQQSAIECTGHTLNDLCVLAWLPHMHNFNVSSPFFLAS